MSVLFRRPPGLWPSREQVCRCPRHASPSPLTECAIKHDACPVSKGQAYRSQRIVLLSPSRPPFHHDRRAKRRCRGQKTKPHLRLRQSSLSLPRILSSLLQAPTVAVILPSLPRGISKSTTTTERARSSVDKNATGAWSRGLHAALEPQSNPSRRNQSPAILHQRNLRKRHDETGDSCARS